jgi:hypothetical protein
LTPSVVASTDVPSIALLLDLHVRTILPSSLSGKTYHVSSEETQPDSQKENRRADWLKISHRTKPATIGTPDEYIASKILMKGLKSQRTIDSTTISLRPYIVIDAAGSFEPLAVD